jgi:hypothetical protein
MIGCAAPSSGAVPTKLPRSGLKVMLTTIRSCMCFVSSGDEHRPRAAEKVDAAAGAASCASPRAWGCGYPPPPLE